MVFGCLCSRNLALRDHSVSPIYNALQFSTELKHIKRALLINWYTVWILNTKKPNKIPESEKEEQKETQVICTGWDGQQIRKAWTKYPVVITCIQGILRAFLWDPQRIRHPHLLQAHKNFAATSRASQGQSTHGENGGPGLSLSMWVLWCIICRWNGMAKYHNLRHISSHDR